MSASARSETVLQKVLGNFLYLSENIPLPFHQTPKNSGRIVSLLSLVQHWSLYMILGGCCV